MARRFQAGKVYACLSATLVVLAGTSVRGVEPLFLDVLLIDTVGMSTDVLTDAQRTAARIFDRLDVRVAWLDTQAAERRRLALDGPAAQRAFLKLLYMVRFVAPGGQGRMTPPDRALGSAAIGTRVASIVFRRVEDDAASAGAPVPLVLGHVVAHELGHLLLGRATHAAAGLMQATLNIPLAQQGRLVFTDDEAQSIRAAIARDAAGQ